MWCLIPSTCSQEAAEEHLPTNCLDTDLLELSKSASIPEKFCLQGSLTEAYLASLFGTTSRLSATITQQHEPISNTFEKGGRDSPYVAGSRNCARTLVQQDQGKGLTESDPAFSLNWSGLWAKYDHAASSLKIAQISLITGLHESCVGLPRWGTLYAGELWELPEPAQAMYERGAGYLPTPLASDNRDRGDITNPSIKRRMRIGKQIGLSALFKGTPCPLCVEGMMGWPANWTSSKNASRPLAMGNHHTPQHSPGTCSQTETE